MKRSVYGIIPTPEGSKHAQGLDVAMQVSDAICIGLSNAHFAKLSLHHGAWPSFVVVEEREGDLVVRLLWLPVEFEERRAQVLEQHEKEDSNA